MQIQQNISLKPYNTFSIDVVAKHFARFSSLDELRGIFSFAKEQGLPVMIIGGGSNILFTHDYNGIVAKNEMKGIEVVNKDADSIYVRSAAGEIWHEFVMYCVDHNYGGVENLSLIWGNVGASPMQNIGAYGVEIKDTFYELEAYGIQDNNIVTFTKDECEFGYRESVFKRRLKGKYVITSVTFKLNKNPTFNTSYGAIQQELDKMGITELSIKAISHAVINIRQSKLPDPMEIGNAGSFFKNPTIASEQFEKLKNEHPSIVGYPAGCKVKVAAGWLIENCGWKGFKRGDAGCHAKQALVLVNYGNANGQEIYDLSTEIMESIYDKFAIELEREVNIM